MEHHHPPISYGTRKSPQGDMSRLSDVKTSADRIFKEALPQETSSGSMALNKGSGGFYLWRPNNYRRGMRVKPQKSAFKKSTPEGLKRAPSNGLAFIQVTPRVKLQYGKHTMTAIWSQFKIGKVKEAWRVPKKGFREWVNAKKDEIAAELDAAMIAFCREHDLLVPGNKPAWQRYEDWFKGEEFVDNIPTECIIYADGLKKVYEDGIEFVRSSSEESPVDHMANYVKNRMLEDFTPSITRELNRLYDLLAARIDPVSAIFERVRRFPDDVLSLSAEIGELTREQKNAFEERCFAAFGGAV